MKCFSSMGCATLPTLTLKPPAIFSITGTCFSFAASTVFSTRLFHWLAAADKLTAAGMKDFNDIATDFTFINLKFLGHTISFQMVMLPGFRKIPASPLQNEGNPRYR